MAIPELLPESRPRLAQDHRRAPTAPRLSAASLPLRRYAQDTMNTQSGPPTSWDLVSQPLNTHSTSNHRASRSVEYPSYPQSPASARLLSPFGLKEESVSPAGFPLYLRDAPREILRRKPEQYDGGSDVAFSSPQPFQSYHGSFSHSLASGPRQTRSMTPELGDHSIYSKRPRSSLPPDPITEKLNEFRTTQNKSPLPLLANLSTLRAHSEASSRWENLPEPDDNIYQQPRPHPRQEIKKRRTRSLETTHCNIKYHVEELDYIRYHRVDLGLKWTLVETKFKTMFPKTVFSVVRKTGGLQGVNYRQNKFLPRLNDAGELVFMQNGHVQPVCIKTRDQTEKKHLYTLVYLFPERAMDYPWVSPMDQQHARQLNRFKWKGAATKLRNAEHISNTYPPIPHADAVPGKTVREARRGE
ncbi:hypothetical protein F5X97DRAFT_338178 [Nemania serpens]|nr:hypothetical protein F5X97DRAFT_338178 [Nemania serpens]